MSGGDFLEESLEDGAFLLVALKDYSGQADFYQLLEGLWVQRAVVLDGAQLGHLVKLVLLVLDLERSSHYFYSLYRVPVICTLGYCGGL